MYFVCKVCTLSLLTLHLHHDQGTHKKKRRRLLFEEHIWTSLRLNIPNVTWAGNDLFTGSVVTPAKRQWDVVGMVMVLGGGSGWWFLWKDVTSTQSSSGLKIWLCSSMILGCVWRYNLPFDFHSVGRMGGCWSPLPWAITSNPYQGQADSLINTD